jgi:hypothetical protein
MSRRLIIAALSASALVLSPGCATLSAVGTATDIITTISDRLGQPVQVPLSVKRNYYRALVGAVGLERMASAAVDVGLLTPGSRNAVFVADKLNDLKRVMDALRAARRAADANSLAARVNEANAIIDELAPLVGFTRN